MCALLLGLAWPLLSALPAVPSQVLAGNVYVVTQGSGQYSINESLVENLSAQAWAEAVSPEIFSFGTIAGSAVAVRGVDLAPFLAVEGVQAFPPSPLPSAWALAGTGLQARLSLSSGQELTLVGSAVPRLDVVPLVGTFRTANAANDELLVDFGTARFLTGIGPSIYHSIRVKTTDPSSLVAFLEARGASAFVSGPSGSVGGANTQPLPTDPRIINLFLRYGFGPVPADYLSQGIVQATNSVQVVAWGLEALVALLVALGIHAILARAFADARETVGVLRALGASGGWMRLRALREVLPMAAVAALLGSGGGFLAAYLLTPNAVVVAFGHAVRVAFDPLGLLLVAAAVVLVAAVSEVVLLQSALRARPVISLRDAPVRGTPPSLEVVLRE